MKSVRNPNAACVRCGRALNKEDDLMEWQEQLVISFRAGYGSVFGDGNYVEGCFCQQCIRKTLGSWLQITADDPFDPQYKTNLDAKNIFQPNQLSKDRNRS